MEQQGLEFHQRVRQGYLEIAASNADRFMIIDACDPTETVAEAIWKKVKPLLPLFQPLP
jgi:dTMP kinase